MNTASSLFTRLLLGAVLAISPLTSEAKPTKGEGKQRAKQSQARSQAGKAPKRTEARSAPRVKQQRIAKTPSRNRVTKPARSKPRASIAQQQRVSSQAKRAKATANQSARSLANSSGKQRNSRAGRAKNLAAIQETPELKATKSKRSAQLKTAKDDRSLTGRDVDATRPNRNDRNSRRDRQSREDRRVETAQERERRDQRLRERERIGPARKQQLAERKEHRRDRVERFRDNRQRRFAAVQRQRRALRAANIAARRAYAHEVREEIREYWEDRADDIRDRIADRYDDLFDDDWWEHTHWHHGPILVSDPWWWWRPARWGSVNLFINAGWSEPIAYDYGTDVIYDDDVVYVHGEPYGSPMEYNRRVVELANPAIPAIAEAPITEDSWQPLGVWALAQEEQGDAVMFFQLSVNREGIISGAYTNVMSGEELPISGSVDRKTQRAAWHIGDEKEKVFEAGMANLTQDQASCLVHVGDGETQNWLLVRMPDPNLPNKPATLGQLSN